MPGQTPADCTPSCLPACLPPVAAIERARAPEPQRPSIRPRIQPPSSGVTTELSLCSAVSVLPPTPETFQRNTGRWLTHFPLRARREASNRTFPFSPTLSLSICAHPEGCATIKYGNCVQSTTQAKEQPAQAGPTHGCCLGALRQRPKGKGDTSSPHAPGASRAGVDWSTLDWRLVPRDPTK